MSYYENKNRQRLEIADYILYPLKIIEKIILWLIESIKP